MIEGNIEIRIEKSEKMINLKKKLQILMIRLWSQCDAKQKDTFYLIDRFDVVSLMPPADDGIEDY
jgi:hypothetical protein